MYIRVKVKTHTKKEELKKISADRFEISVKEKAEKNLANKRIVEILLAFFNLQKGKIRIIKGHQSPTKLLLIDNEE